jgi:N-acetylmuramate 1-kinase
MADRQSARKALLQRAGWGDATSVFLAGDASDRTYDRLSSGNQTAVLMDAPPGKGDDTGAFVAVAGHLQQLGLSAPRILAQDLANGFLLLEDFGDAVFARTIAAAPQTEQDLYAAAIDAVVTLQSHPPMAGLPAFSTSEWAKAATLVFDEYQSAVDPARQDTSAFLEVLCASIDHVRDNRQIMILRDYHAENLIWLPNRTGAARAGLLDFQLAQMGHSVYDIVSLLQDARRDVGLQTAQRMATQFCDAKGLFLQNFQHAMAVWGAQRALRILGVFARLARRSGKTGYLKLIPRVWNHLQVNLRHPQLSDLKRICDQMIAAPTPALLERLAQDAAR